MDLWKYESELKLEILQAENNDTVKQLMLAWDKLPGEARGIFKVAVAIAYDEGLKDWYNPLKTNTRV